MTDAQADRMIELLEQIARQTAGPMPAVLGDLQALASVDPDAAKAEARRRSAEYGRQRRKERP